MAFSHHLFAMLNPNNMNRKCVGFVIRELINASQRRTLLAGFAMISRRNTSFNVQAAQLSNNLGSAMYNKIRRSVRMDCLIQTVLLPTRIHTSMKEYT